MKILFITAFPPNAKTAGQNYTRLLLNELIINHNVDLIYWKYPDHEVDIPSNVNILQAYDSHSPVILNTFITKLFPLFSKRFSSSASKYIDSIKSNYDLIYFDFSQVFVYSLKLNHPFKIGMSHDVITQKFSRHKLAKYLIPWIKYSEKKCLKEMTHVFTFSQKDSDFLLNKLNIKSKPVSFFLDSKILNMDENMLEPSNYFVLYGAWNRPENQETINWLINNAELRQYNLKIIGGGMPLKYQSQITSDFKNWEYIGFIENPYEIIASSNGLIAPLWHGAGVKVKVIESLALGTPVVGTNITFEGISGINYGTNNDSALINLSDIKLEDELVKLSNLRKSNKIEIRNSFLSGYNNTHITNYL